MLILTLLDFTMVKPERWKGWSYLPNPNKTIVGVVRDTHSWIGLDGTRYLALGTDRKLYLFILKVLFMTLHLLEKQQL